MLRNLTTPVHTATRANCVCVRVFLCAHTHALTDTHTQPHVHTHTHVCIPAYTHAQMHTDAGMNTHASTLTQTHAPHSNTHTCTHLTRAHVHSESKFKTNQDLLMTMTGNDRRRGSIDVMGGLSRQNLTTFLPSLLLLLPPTFLSALHKHQISRLVLVGKLSSILEEMKTD